jgi:hypothetical protein
VKDIPGFEGLYAITKDGQVWTYGRPWRRKVRGGKIATGNYPAKFIKHNGKTVHLTKDSKQNGYSVKSLIDFTYYNKPLYKKITAGFTKTQSRRRLYHALEKGYIIRPKKCEKCNSDSKLEAHHHDYEKPLDVLWLCRNCHVRLHMTNSMRIVNNKPTKTN